MVGAQQKTEALQGYRQAGCVCSDACVQRRESIYLARVELLGNLELLAHMAKKLSTVTVPVVPSARPCIVCVLLGHD